MGWPFSSEAYTIYRSRQLARQFLQTATKLRHKPVIIVDIRGNTGGNTMLGQYWLFLLTGEIVPSNARDIIVWSPYVVVQGNVFGEEEDLHYYAEKLFEYFGADMYALEAAETVDGFVLDENHFAFGYIPDRIVQNEQLLIFLTDRNTSSAGEVFTDLSFNLENSLVIGQNTMGNLLTAINFAGITLPNSGVPFNFGSSIHAFPQGHLPESIGITPDIWVSGDALAAVLAMLVAH
jgi:hypothetical protein